MADLSVSEPRGYPARDFAVLRVRTGNTVRVVVKGEVDIATSPRLHEQIKPLLASDAELVVLDLERVTFIDSTGLGILIHAYEQFDGRLRIAVSPPVARLLEITAIRDRLPIVDSGFRLTPRRPPTRTRPLRARTDECQPLVG